jgi:hypothetical protein
VKATSRFVIAMLLMCVVLGCDSMELTIGVVEGPSGTLEVANANDAEWIDTRLVVETVESDNSKSLCVEKNIGVWKPGETISVPACGTKIRLTLTTGGETARFSYVNGQLFRVFGRKEVPVAP